MLRDEYFDIKDKPRDFLGLPLFNDQDFIIKKILKINKIDIRDEINRNLVFRHWETQNILNADILGIIKDEHFRNEKILTNKEIDWLLTNFCGEFFLTKQLLLDLVEKLVHCEDKNFIDCQGEYDRNIKVSRYRGIEERKRFIYIFELKKIHIINLLSKSLAEKNSIKIDTLVDFNNLNLNLGNILNLEIYFTSHHRDRWIKYWSIESGELVNFLIDNFNKVLVEINNIDNNIINNQTIEFLEGSSYKEHINNESFENELMDNISVFSHYSSERKQDFYNTPYVASHLYYKAILEIEKVLREEISFLESINIDNDQKNKINSKQEILNKISEAKEFVAWLLFALNYKTKFFFIENHQPHGVEFYFLSYVHSYYGRNSNFLNSIKDVNVEYTEYEYDSKYKGYGKGYGKHSGVYGAQTKEDTIDIDLNVNNWDFSNFSKEIDKEKNKDINKNFFKINFHYANEGFSFYQIFKIKSSFFLNTLLKAEKHKWSKLNHEKEEKDTEIKNLKEEISRLNAENADIKQYEDQKKSTIIRDLTEIETKKSELEDLLEITKKEKTDSENLCVVAFMLFITTCLSVLILSLLYYKKNKNNINKYANKQ